MRRGKHRAERLEHVGASVAARGRRGRGGDAAALGDVVDVAIPAQELLATRRDLRYARRWCRRRPRRASSPAAATAAAGALGDQRGEG